MEITYRGPYPAVTANGQRVEQGDTVTVPDELGALLVDGGEWQKAPEVEDDTKKNKKGTP